ncbi:hypothetical protein IEZ26_06740 [Nocardioides cavernae]|uniref:Uncharacterized protein n=1 Tax=Nocardioides cavernae TaxID=1921566 RepID=A0ABR8N836_9ACTN|nr:hypothetical protein [Nocardioides cavernae]MBD3924313.1 hypothetical protein [Nocardioides cavernae]MBM7510744.1 hypothetical protein [Nocardioides cavernae]
MNIDEAGTAAGRAAGGANDSSAGSRNDNLNSAIAAVRRGIDDLARELADLDTDHPVRGATPLAVLRLVGRALTDVASRASAYAPNLDPHEVSAVVTTVFEGGPLTDDRLGPQRALMRTHFESHLRSLQRWMGWEAAEHAVDGKWYDDVTTRTVTAFKRDEDGAVASDLLGFVDDPADLALPGRPFLAFVRDVEAAYGELVAEYGEDAVKGIRLWILGSDGRPVVRWFPPRWSPED